MRSKLLKAYEDLRVCDVRDGMDALGYFFYGSMDPSIRPLYRTRAFGIAKTVRYLPFRGLLDYKNPRQYRDKITPEYYNKICIYPWVDKIEDGDFMVIDQSSTAVGLIGSENSLNCFNKGMRGLVTNGGVRDSDETILEQIPCWSAMSAQTMVQARIAFESMGNPVSVGGVHVQNGDVVVADGDGVIVVPQEIAFEVATYAHEEHQSDKKNRKQHYITGGRDLDDTL